MTNNKYISIAIIIAAVVVVLSIAGVFSLAVWHKNQTTISGEKGVGDLNIEWRAQWSGEGFLTLHTFNLYFRNNENKGLTYCQLTINDTKNDLADLLVHGPNQGSMSKYFSDNVVKVEPDVWYEIGDNSDVSSFVAGTSMPDLSKPPQKVKLECDGKVSEWQIKY